MAQEKAIAHIFEGNEKRLIMDLSSGLVVCDDVLLNLCLAHGMLEASEYIARRFNPAKSTFALMVSKLGFSDSIIDLLISKNPDWIDMGTLMTTSYLEDMGRFKRLAAIDNFKTVTDEQFIKTLLDNRHFIALEAVENLATDLFWQGLIRSLSLIGVLNLETSTILYRRSVVRTLKDFAKTRELQEKVMIFCAVQEPLTILFNEV